MELNPQHNETRHSRSLCVVVCSALLACLMTPAMLLATQDDDNDPTTTPGARMELPEFELIDTHGKTVTRADLVGQPCVISFVFSRCVSTCRPITMHMKQLHDKLADTSTKFVSITVDPDYDTPEIFGKFADIYEPDYDRWIFLSGSKEHIYRVATQGFRLYVRELFGKDAKPGYEVMHTNKVVLLNDKGQPVKTFLADGATSDVELNDLRRILEGKKAFPEPPPEPEPKKQAPTEDESSPAVSPTVEKDDARKAPDWVMTLPAINAGLNAFATLLLIVGFIHIKNGKRELHKRFMLTAFATSILFLAFYVVYHVALHQYTGSGSRRFTGTGTVRPVYFTILITHVVLAAIVPVMASITILHGLRERWDKHRRIAKLTFPIWVYVSVTGVIIYFMLYHWPQAAA